MGTVEVAVAVVIVVVMLAYFVGGWIVLRL